MNYAALKAKIATYPDGTTDADILTDITSTTSSSATTRTTDAVSTGVMGTLYARGSWDRVVGVMLGQYPSVTGLPIVICHNLATLAASSSPVPMTTAAVAAKVGADLAALQATKLPDGKGILWAPDELAAGDPGDATVLILALSQKSVSWADANGCSGVNEGDVQTARAQP